MDTGVHSPRATFCLFFILSGGGFYDVMRNARHQTEHQAKKRHRDAVARCWSWAPPKLSSLEGHFSPQERWSSEKAHPSVTNKKGSSPPQGSC